MTILGRMIPRISALIPSVSWTTQYLGNPPTNDSAVSTESKTTAEQSKAPSRVRKPGEDYSEEEFSKLPLPQQVDYFAAKYNIVSRTYSYRYDEALKRSHEHALAMRRDAFILGCLQERYAATATLPWSVIPEDPKDVQQAEIASILTKLIAKTPTWTSLLYYLLDAIWYGRFGSQIKWGRVSVDGRDWWGVIEHNPINGDKIGYDWDGTPFVYVYTPTLNQYPKEFILYTDRVPALKLSKPDWRNQFIFHHHAPQDADFFQPEMAGGIHGVGLRSQLYWRWDIFARENGWLLDYLRKAGMMIFFAKPNNQRALDAATLAIAKAMEQQMFVVPMEMTNQTPDWGILPFQFNTQSIDQLTKNLEAHEKICERLIVGQSLSSGTEGSGLGGTGVASLHKNTKQNLLTLDADRLSETITNDLLRPLCQNNFPEFLGKFRFKLITEDDKKKEKMDAVIAASGIGVTFVEDEIRELTGMRKPVEGEKTVGGQTAMPGIGPDSEGKEKKNVDEKPSTLKEEPKET